MGRWSLNPPAHDVIETGKSRHLFRVCECARHHPSARTRRFNCLLKLRRAFWPAPTQGTLIKVRHLNHRLTKPAPDTTPAATPLARLFLFFTTAVTLVGRPCVRACQACPKLPLRHSFQRATTR